MMIIMGMINISLGTVSLKVAFCQMFGGALWVVFRGSLEVWGCFREAPRKFGGVLVGSRGFSGGHKGNRGYGPSHELLFS